jgi:hypothetical protein
MPTRKVNAKSLIPPPPKRNSERVARKTVPDVMMVRLSV